MRNVRLFISVICVLLSFPLIALAQSATTSDGGLAALARLSGNGVEVHGKWGGLDLTIEMTRPVPWRVFTLDQPRRLVVDFSELDWTGLDREEVLYESDKIADLRAGLYRPGWSRLVLDLNVPLAVTQSEMRSDDGVTRMILGLKSVSEDVFADRAGVPEEVLAERAVLPATPAQTRQRGDGPLVVVLDPGHGGIDPGASRDGVVEADLMLTFAKELRDVLLRSGGFDIVLTREEDHFVSLEERVRIARRAGADVYLSLHADALAQGRATGATVYTLSKEASDVASEKLAERHNRADLLAGVDLSHHDDEVALVLMDLARTNNSPRSNALADALVEGINSATGSIYKNPRLQAGFSVLKSADIPSVLIELGFMSSPKDLAKMVSPDWRKDAATGIRDALQYWAIQDAAQADLLRK